MQIGSSFLMAIMAKLALGASTLEGHQLILHPLACRMAWPVGYGSESSPHRQLDGGHIAHAMFGARRGHAISVGLMTLLPLRFCVAWADDVGVSRLVHCRRSRCAAVE